MPINNIASCLSRCATYAYQNNASVSRGSLIIVALLVAACYIALMVAFRILSRELSLCTGPSWHQQQTWLSAITREALACHFCAQGQLNNLAMWIIYWEFFFHYVLLACHFCAQGHLGNLAMWMEVWLRAMAAAWDLAREGASADVAQVGSRGGVGGGLGVQAAWGKPVCMSMGPNT